MILPLLSRFDRRDEVAESDKWLARFARDMKPVFDDWLPRQYSPSQILELTKIPYITRFSFGEPLPVLTHSLTDPELPGFYLKNVARLIRTDFREAAQIIDPRAPSDQGVEAEIAAVIQQAPIDEVKLLRLLRDAEQEFGESSQVASLFARAGNALYEHVRLASALPLMKRALAIDEASYGPEHLRMPIQAKENFQLTSREQSVIEHLAKGWTNKEIADALQITEQTVKVHIMHIMKKTNSTTRTGILVHIFNW